MSLIEIMYSFHLFFLLVRAVNYSDTFYPVFTFQISQFGTSSFGASAHYTHRFSSKSHGRVAGRVGRYVLCSLHYLNFNFVNMFNLVTHFYFVHWFPYPLTSITVIVVAENWICGKDNGIELKVISFIYLKEEGV